MKQMSGTFIRAKKKWNLCGHRVSAVRNCLELQFKNSQDENKTDKEDISPVGFPFICPGNLE
jgi:hypothetical protein